MKKNQLGNMLDITAPKNVQIQVRDDKKVIWVHIDGQTVLRICQIDNLSFNIPSAILKNELDNCLDS